MVKNLKIFSVFLVLFLIVLSISLISAIDDIGGGFKMNGGQTRTIDVHSICKIVYNEVARNVFVPTKTAGEWQSFMDNLPYGVVLRACPYCGDGSCNGGETCSSCATDCGACAPPSNCFPPCEANEQCQCDYLEGQTICYCKGDVGVSCFVAGTKVTMADGGLKNIEDIQVGEMVKSFNEATKQFEIQEVLEVESPIREGYYNLYFGDNKLIQVTNEHPFYTKKPDGSVAWCSIVPEKTHSFYPHLYFVGQLEKGDMIYTDTGTWVKVHSWDYIDGQIQVYNLKHIEHTTTFFANGLLVHNKIGGGDGGGDGGGPSCFIGNTPISMADGTYKPIEDIKMRDLVKVYDEKTHQIENAPVKKIQTIYHNNVHELHLSNGKILKPTANHPFLVKEKGWATISDLDELNIGAGKLEIGDYVYSLNSKGNLEEVKVADIIPVKGNYLTYNLIDMEYGTFLADDIVVHNSGDGIGPGCFISGTRILMSDYTYKHIEDVKIGETVISYNEKTQENQPAKVLKIFEHPKNSPYLIINNFLKVTPNHPVFVNGKWKKIGSVKIGDILKDVYGNNIKIKSIKEIHLPVTVYNLEVESTHTYYAENILVHNKLA